MGTYVYHLLRKSRKVMIDGVSTDVHLLKYAYKDGWETPKLMMAQQRRLEYAWGTEAPAYVVKGDYMAGAPVYSDWPCDGRGEPYVSIVETPTATWVGYLRAKANRFYLERWYNMSKECSSYDEAHKLSDQLRGLLGEGVMTEVATKSGRILLTAFYLYPKDAVALKLAMS